jgi:hypothetical protein
MEPMKRDNWELADIWFRKASHIIAVKNSLPFYLIYILCSEHNKKLRRPETRNRKKPGTLIPL